MFKVEHFFLWMLRHAFTLIWMQGSHYLLPLELYNNCETDLHHYLFFMWERICLKLVLVFAIVFFLFFLFMLYVRSFCSTQALFFPKALNGWGLLLFWFLIPVVYQRATADCYNVYLSLETWHCYFVKLLELSCKLCFVSFFIWISARCLCVGMAGYASSGRPRRIKCQPTFYMVFSIVERNI